MCEVTQPPVPVAVLAGIQRVVTSEDDQMAGRRRDRRWRNLLPNLGEFREVVFTQSTHFSQSDGGSIEALAVLLTDRLEAVSQD